MASVNKILVIGNLGRDPEVRYTANGDCVANISVGTTDKWKDKATGETREATEWHRVSVFGKSAEYISKYAKKGSQIYVEGSLRTRKWQDKDGQDRYTTEVRAEDVQLLGSRPQGAGGNDGDRQASGGEHNGDQSYQRRPSSGSGQPRGNEGGGGRQQNDRDHGGGYHGGGGGGAYADDIPFQNLVTRKTHLVI